MMRFDRIVIKGAIGNGNFGDDLLIYSAIQLLKRNKVDNLVVSSTPQGVSYLKLLFLDGVKVLSTDELVLSETDLLFYAGGTQFATFDRESFIKYPSFKRLCFLCFHPKLFYRKMQMLSRNKQIDNKVIMVGLGIGPFAFKNNYYYHVVELLRSSLLLSVRDVLSAKICSDNGIEHYLLSDLVYSLPRRFWASCCLKLPLKSECRIAVIIRDWDYTNIKESYYNAIEGLTNLRNIYFVSFSKNADKRVTDIVCRAGHQVLQWDPTVFSFEYFISKLNEFDLFVTSRYHGAIIGSLLHKPFVAINIEPKLAMIADNLNMPKWSMPFDICEIPKLQRAAFSSTAKYLVKVESEIEKSERMESIIGDCMKKYLN